MLRCQEASIVCFQYGVGRAIRLLILDYNNKIVDGKVVKKDVRCQTMIFCSGIESDVQGYQRQSLGARKMISCNKAININQTLLRTTRSLVVMLCRPQQ